MKTFNKIISSIFRLTLIFLFTFIWFRYFISDLSYSLIVSILSTLIIDLFITLIRRKKSSIASLKNSEIKKAENYCNKFVFSEPSYAVNFFFKLAKTRHEAKKTKHCVIIEHENSCTLLYPFFTFEEFGTTQLIIAYNEAKKNNSSKLVLCVNEAGKNVKNVADKLDIKIIILNKFDTYNKLFKEYNYYPEELQITTQPTTFKSLLAYSLNKKRTKGYLFASIILVLSSFIVKYNIYYLVMSSVLLILALLSFINPKYNKVEVENLLD